MNADFSFHIDDVTLNEYLDAALAPERRAEVEVHLAACAACAARLAEGRRLFAALESLPAAPLERDLTYRVLSALRPRPAPWPALARLALAAQAALAVVFTGVTAVMLFTTLTPADSFLGPTFETLAQSAQALTRPWQTLAETAQTFIASGMDSVLAFLPPSFEWTWVAGLVAVLLLWLAGNGVVLRNLLQPPHRSHP